MFADHDETCPDCADYRDFEFIDASDDDAEEIE
jgi:hypothetical protein